MNRISSLNITRRRWIILTIASTGWALLWFGGGGCASSAPSSGRESTPILPWGGGGVKIGYIRSDVIMQKLPEYRDAENTLQRENEGWLKEAENLESQIRIKESQLEELRLILSEERRKTMEDELAELKRKLYRFRQDTWYAEDCRYIRRRREIFDPIDAKVTQAVKKVAEERGLDIVIDTVSGNVVYGKPVFDITELVIEELKR